MYIYIYSSGSNEIHTHTHKHIHTHTHTHTGMPEQIRSGKCFLLNKRDKSGRPVVVVSAHKHRYSVYLLY